jgi:hypothetical protein
VREFELGSHPESFQLEKTGSRIFVNLPDQEAIGVIDQKTGAVTKWKIPGHSNTHAMALDEVNHRLFTAALQPGRFVVVDSESGATVARLPCVLGVDDLWFDATRKRIYAPGSGAIDIFQQIDADSNRLTLTITPRSRMSQSGRGPAAPVFISRRAHRTVCSCRGLICFPMVGPRYCSSTSMNEL